MKADERGSLFVSLSLRSARELFADIRRRCSNQPQDDLSCFSNFLGWVTETLDEQELATRGLATSSACCTVKAYSIDLHKWAGDNVSKALLDIWQMQAFGLNLQSDWYDKANWYWLVERIWQSCQTMIKPCWMLTFEITQPWKSTMNQLEFQAVSKIWLSSCYHQPVTRVSPCCMWREWKLSNPYNAL